MGMEQSGQLDGQNKQLINLFYRTDKIYYAQDDGGRPRPLGFDGSAMAHFFAVNPLDPTGWRERSHGQTTPRFGLNVTAFRNFIFESDTEALDDQLAKWLKLSEVFPIATLTYSGGKSYHAILSLQDTLPFKPHTESGLIAYSRAWKALAAEITKLSGLKLDKSTKDPARLTRLAGAYRGEVEQKAIEAPTLGRYIDAAAVLGLMRQYPDSEPAANVVPPPAFTGSLFELDQLLKARSPHLHDRLRYPQTWASTENMYPEVLRFVLWAIDVSGAPENVLLNYLQKYTFPTIISMGYPRDLTVPVRNAYIWKGF